MTPKVGFLKFLSETCPPERACQTYCVSGNGRCLAGLTSDHITIWTISPMGTLAFSTQFSYTCDTRFAASLNADGSLIAVANYTFQVTIISISTGRLAYNDERMTCVAFDSNQPDRLAAGCSRSVIVWEGGRRAHTLDGHTTYVACVAFQPSDPGVVVSAAHDGVFVWDIRSGDYRRLVVRQLSDIPRLMFAPSGEYLAITAGIGVLVVDARQFTQAGLSSNDPRSAAVQILTHLGHRIRNVCFSPDSKLLLSRSVTDHHMPSMSHYLRVWRSPSGDGPGPWTEVGSHSAADTSRICFGAVFI